MPPCLPLKPTVRACTLRTTILKNVLSHKKTAQLIIVHDEISFSSAARTFDCERSLFRDEHHDHVVTK